MSALLLADGPAMYFGGTIMTFALPLGAFIAAALALYFLFRAGHSGPRLKYLSHGHVASVTTREPGPAPAPSVRQAETETAAPETAAPRTAAQETASREGDGGEA